MWRAIYIFHSKKLAFGRIDEQEKGMNKHQRFLINQW
jgi:hypothetical protein